jgi:hypothetical protein
MARSGSEKRQREITLKARFNDAEAALVREQAGRAGVSVASLIRFAVLNQTPLRASRRPVMEREEIAQLIGNIGLLKSALLKAADGAASERCRQDIEAACRDIADMRVALFEALERAP